MHTLQCGIQFSAIARYAVRAQIGPVGGNRAADQQKDTAMSFVTTVRGALDKRRQYHRTVRALRTMPLDVALDLDLARSDAKSTARQAVYG